MTGSPLLDPACPVDGRHPLNRGRLAWWFVAPNPGWQGGSIWHDLCRRREATLTNGPAWKGQGASHLGGSGCVRLDGVNDYATAPSLRVPLATWTIAAWGRKTASGVMTILSQGSNGPPDIYNYYVRIGSNAGFTSDAGGGATVYNYLDTPEPALGVWHRFLVAYTGINLRYWVDGELIASGFAGGSAATPVWNSNAPIEIGRYAGYGLQYWQGDLDDVSLWGRALSTAEVRVDFNLSRCGYPGVLRRLGGPLAVGETVVGTSPGSLFQSPIFSMPSF